MSWEFSFFLNAMVILMKGREIVRLGSCKSLGQSEDVRF